jgi:geranylgeranyl reductase family protein
MRADVAVVGGGPAGCFVGGILAKRGLDVVIVEEHAEVGNPVCCAGIVSVSGLRELGIKPGEWVLGKLRRAVIYPPSNEPIELTQGKVEAFVVDRAEFDRSLARDAARAGAKFFFKSRCTEVKLRGEPVLDVKGIQGGQLRARLVIGADGPASVIARKAGLVRSRKFLKGAQMEIIADTPEDAAEVYFGRSFAPGFFGWLVRAGDVTRAGICCARGDPLRMLYNFVEKHPVVSEKLSGGKVLNLCIGPIPESWSRKIYADRLMLVGDAAGQLKPLTGGGIYLGLSCARMAAEVAVRALEGEPDRKALQAYERAVEGSFGEEFRLGLRTRRVFEQMPDEEVNAVLGLLLREDIRELVLKNFDFDYHGRLVRALVPEMPRILKELGIKRALKYTRYLMAS